MKRTIESKIRFNAVLIYVIVAVICCGMILFIYKFRSNIDSQRDNIEQYQQELLLTKELVLVINQAQSEANLYAVTKRTAHFRQFRQELIRVDQFVDSLTSIEKEPFQQELLQEVAGLLQEKGRIISALNKQFNSDTPLDSIYEKLNAYEPEIKADSLQVTTTIKDTVIHETPRKGFWKRLSEAFSPPEKKDTVVVISMTQVDTMKVSQPDSLPATSEMNQLTEQARKDYKDRINTIEHQIIDLLEADQKLSSRIADLIIELYNRTLFSRLEEIRKSEQLIRQNNTYSIAGGIIALVLILVFILLIINDVNKGYEARKALEEANIRAQQIMESRHQLLLSVSHDIKTPLNSILGYLELSNHDKALSQNELRSMQNSGKYMYSLLENLLEFSSLEQGTLNAIGTDFNFRSCCEEIVEICRPLALQKGLDFEYYPDFDEALFIHSDPLKLKQIMINILSNSIKYTLSGSVDFRVSYREGRIDFEVRDTGVGIPEEQIPVLFKPFARVEKNSSLAEGSGLGMYVVKGLTELLGGKISLTSVVGQGTRVRVEILAKSVVVKKILISRKILIVDDDYSFLMMLRNMLIRLGHEVHFCTILAEFEKLLPEIGQYDTILTDMEMGLVSGVDLLKMIRNTGIPMNVILMTARSDFGPDKAHEAGFDSYLQKPVTISSLARVLGCAEPPDFEYDLLGVMFDDDADAIREILEIFVHSTEEHIRSLQKACLSGNFAQVQALCHKMLPMFMQIGVKETTVFLQKMDVLRSEGEEKYPSWKEDLGDFIQKAEVLIGQIRKQYLQS